MENPRKNSAIRQYFCESRFTKLSPFPLYCCGFFLKIPPTEQSLVFFLAAPTEIGHRQTVCQSTIPALPRRKSGLTELPIHGWSLVHVIRICCSMSPGYTRSKCATYITTAIRLVIPVNRRSWKLDLNLQMEAERTFRKITFSPEQFLQEQPTKDFICSNFP